MKQEPISNLTPEGQLLAAAIQNLREKIEKHKCAECERALMHLSNAMIGWLGRPSKDEPKKFAVKVTVKDIFK